MYPLSIKCTCLEYCYTKLGRCIYIEQCTYTHGRLTPHHLSVVALNIVTPNLADVPQSIKHRCLQYNYTKLGRSIYIEQCTYTHGRLTPHHLSMVALNIVTPNLADVPQSIKHRCLQYHYTKLGRSILYRTMHIYPWQIDPPSLEHGCLEYCYTKLGRCPPVNQA